MATLEKCKVCSGTVSTTALTCPHCGDSLRGGLKGLDAVFKERNPGLHKAATVAAWVYVIAGAIPAILVVLFMLKACS